MEQSQGCPGCAAGHPRNADGKHVRPSTIMRGASVLEECTAPAGDAAPVGSYAVGVGGFSPADTQHMLDATVKALRMALPPGVAIALFLVDVDAGAVAFKRDVEKEDRTLFYQALGAWAQATITKETD